MNFRFMTLMGVVFLSGGYSADMSAAVTDINCKTMHIEGRSTCSFRVIGNYSLTHHDAEQVYRPLISKPRESGCDYQIQPTKLIVDGKKQVFPDRYSKFKIGDITDGYHELDTEYELTSLSNMKCTSDTIELRQTNLFIWPSGSTPGSNGLPLILWDSIIVDGSKEWISIPNPKITRVNVPSNITLNYDVKTQKARNVFPISVESTVGVRISIKDQSNNSPDSITLLDSASSETVIVKSGICDSSSASTCQSGAVELKPGDSFGKVSFNNNTEQQFYILLESGSLANQKPGYYSGVGVVLFEAI